MNTADAEEGSNSKPAQAARAEKEKGQRPENLFPAANALPDLPCPRLGVETADAEEGSNGKPAQAARAEEEKGQFPRFGPDSDDT